MMTTKKLTEKEKIRRREERKRARTKLRQLEEIESHKAQKPVKKLTISIEWKKSRTWGANPHAIAQVEYQDGSYNRFSGFTCSGCGYCKESTVIAQIFNHVLRYKLYQQHDWSDTINQQSTNHPYGVYYFGGDTGVRHDDGYAPKPCYNGGVDTSCYYQIAEFIGGKFKNIASGKSFDVFVYTDTN